MVILPRPKVVLRLLYLSAGLRRCLSSPLQIRPRVTSFQPGEERVQITHSHKIPTAVWFASLCLVPRLQPITFRSAQPCICIISVLIIHLSRTQTHPFLWKEPVAGCVMRLISSVIPSSEVCFRHYATIRLLFVLQLRKSCFRCQSQCETWGSTRSSSMN